MQVWDIKTPSRLVRHVRPSHTHPARHSFPQTDRQTDRQSGMHAYKTDKAMQRPCSQPHVQTNMSATHTSHEYQQRLSHLHRSHAHTRQHMHPRALHVRQNAQLASQQPLAPQLVFLAVCVAFARHSQAYVVAVVTFLEQTLTQILMK